MPKKNTVRKKTRVQPKRTTRLPFILWERFVYGLCSKGSIALLENDRANMSVPADSTHFFIVEQLAEKASPPIPIESLSEELLGNKLSRGSTYFNLLGQCLDQIACNYPNMYWWITDNGLNMQRVEPGRPAISDFDEFAGKMTEENWKNARLSREALLNIARALDKKKLPLLDNLQPAQRKAVVSFNQSNSRKNPIRNFEQAACHRRIVRHIRKRLYVSRNRFNRANARMEATKTA